MLSLSLCMVLSLCIGFLRCSDGKGSACNMGEPGSISGLRKSSEEGNATHSSTLTWKIPWMEEPGRLPSMGLQRRLLFVPNAWTLWGFISSLSQKFHELDNKVYQHFKMRQKVRYSSTSKLQLELVAPKACPCSVILLSYMCFLLFDYLFVISVLFKVLLSSQAVIKMWQFTLKKSLLNL